jgi:hypothetical protein
MLKIFNFSLSYISLLVFFFITFSAFLNLFLYTEIHALTILLKECIREIHLLKTEMHAIKTENHLLREMLKIHPKIEPPSELLEAPTPELHIFLIKICLIVVTVFFLSFIVYFLSTSTYAWFYKTFVEQLAIQINNLGIKLLSLFSITQIKTFWFKDSFGHNFKVDIANDNACIEIFIQSLDTLNYISIGEYVSNLNSNAATAALAIGSLNAAIAALKAVQHARASVEPGTGTVNDITITSIELNSDTLDVNETKVDSNIAEELTLNPSNKEEIAADILKHIFD